MVSDLAQILSRSLNPPTAVRHVLDYYSQGTPDSVWIPELAKEDWTIISADRARRAGGPKLPLLCRQFGVTHILLSGKIHCQPQFQKIVSVATVWDDIVATRDAPRGTQFILRLSSSKNPRPILLSKEA
jgi:hypothetical protein